MVTQSMLRTYEGIYVIIRFATAVDLTKCLKQIKLPKFLIMCIHIS